MQILAGTTWGVFTCVGWQVTLCDPIWQVTSRRSEMGFLWRAISAFLPFYLFTNTGGDADLMLQLSSVNE